MSNYATRKARNTRDRRCNEEGCTDKHFGRGKCQKHYRQASRANALGSSHEGLVRTAVPGWGCLSA